MKCLVTGAGGFVGGHLCKALLARGHEVTAAIFPGATAELDCERVSLDVTSQENCLAVVSQLKPERVYHLAGIAFIPEVEKDFEKGARVNGLGVFNLLNALSRNDSECRVMLASSAEVYGKVKESDVPLNEKSPVRLDTHYALSKIIAENVMHRFCRPGSALQGVIARSFNHIGPGQNDRFAASSFARQLARMKLGKEKPVLKRGNLSAKRDMTDVRDIVRGYVAALEHGQLEEGQGTYNFASGEVIVIEAMLQKLIAISGVSPEVQEDPSRMRASDVPILHGDPSLAFETFGWKAEIPLEQSLQDCFDWWVEQESRSDA